MPQRNVNQLLSNSAQPTNGLATTNVKQWYGGPIRVVATGPFDGASVELMYCTKFPDNSDRADYAANPGSYNWISLHTFNAAGEFTLPNLNPCVLASKVTNSGGNSRVKVMLLTA